MSSTSLIGLCYIIKCRYMFRPIIWLFSRHSSAQNQN